MCEYTDKHVVAVRVGSLPCYDAYHDLEKHGISYYTRFQSAEVVALYFSPDPRREPKG